MPFINGFSGQNLYIYIRPTKLLQISEQLSKSVLNRFNQSSESYSVNQFKSIVDNKMVSVRYSILENQISKKVSTVKLGSINTTRDFNYVEDTVNAYIKTLKKDKILDGEIINIGSNFEVSIKDIYKLACKFYNRYPKIEIDRKRFRPVKSEVKRLYACNKKAIKLLKWKPKFSGTKNFYKGIYKTCEWFEKNKKNSSYKSIDYTI